MSPAVAAHLRFKTAIKFSGEKSVVDALIDSSALLLIYRMPKASGDCSIIDGGFFSNLPMNVLKNVSDLPDGVDDDVPIVAMSFDEKGLAEEAETIPQYLLQILHGMIDHQVVSAKHELHENVCPIKTELSTFDTHLFRAALEGKAYYEARDSDADFFKSWIAKQRQRRKEQGRSIKRSDTNRLHELVAELTRFSEREVQALGEIDIDQARIIVTAYSQLPRDSSNARVEQHDRVGIVLQIPKGENPVSCMRTILMTDRRGQFEDITWSVCNADRQPLDLFKFPIYGASGGVTGHVVMFDPPLGTPDAGPGRYAVIYTQLIEDLVEDFNKKNYDIHAYTCQTFRSFGKLDLVLYVPEGLQLELHAVTNARELEVEFN